MAEPRLALEAIGLLPDIEIDPATAALQLARLDTRPDALSGGRPDTDWLAASEHLSHLAREAAAIGAVLTGRSSEERVGALAGLIHARFGYRGDSERYDDLDNANLIRVIERRRGLPVALGVLWLHCIRAAGWDGHGIDFPGHFLVGLATTPAEGERVTSAARQTPVLIDAFGAGAVVGPSELLGLLRRITGREMPLRPGMIRPMTTRDVLLRLQRNLVQRRLLASEVEEALNALEGMLQIAPDVAPNWLHAADLHRHLGQVEDAIACLERFLALVPESDASAQARTQIEELRRQTG